MEEVILLLRFYCHPQSQLGIGIRGLGLGLDNMQRTNNCLGKITQVKPVSDNFFVPKILKMLAANFAEYSPVL